VFTAHPTESARRSVLSKLLDVAHIVQALGADSTPAEERRLTTRLRETILLLCRTSEIRVGRLRPEDEAQNILYYLSQLYDSAVPTLLEDLDDELERHGIVLGFSTSNLRFGPGSAVIETQPVGDPCRNDRRTAHSARSSGSASSSGSSTG